MVVASEDLLPRLLFQCRGLQSLFAEIQKRGELARARVCVSCVHPSDALVANSDN